MGKKEKIAFFGGLALIALFIAAVSANIDLDRTASAAEVSGAISGSTGGSSASGTIGGSLSGSGSSGTIGGSVGSSISGTVGGGGGGGGGGGSSSGPSGGGGGGGGDGDVLGAATGPGDNGQVLGEQFVPSLPVTGMSPFLFVPWLVGMLALILWLSYYVANLERSEKEGGRH